ncbi:DUF2079 domain-containing protein [Streptomyces sp. NBC_01304]|uniref:DUF2079 domain-containing protein n=1 Tax=Streptomyces sp. NBC_01304 TaxID=2903818 RepID=UPI002E15B199|nr:DUF2079 domain-containing protein [Streptomyces sp. NBC_01304]
MIPSAETLPRPAPAPDSADPAGARPRRRVPLWWGWAGALFAVYAVLSVRRHALLRSHGYDLGIFEQAVRAYAHFEAPAVPLLGDGFNLLGDHFHPILAVLGPFYRVWPSPLCLLTAQAALLAVAVVPLARWAHRVLGAGAAHVVAFGYGGSWAIAQTVAFDFHEVVFAVPLLACALEALGRERWGRAVAWAAPLVLVKEDLGMTLAAVGAYVALRGPRRLGLITAAAGVAASVLTVKVLLPAVNPAGRNAHWDRVSGAAEAGGARDGLVSTLAHLPFDALTPQVKPILLILVFAPTAMVALRSPLAWIAVPTLGWRLLSHHPFHWNPDFHYGAVLMPVVFAALVDALARWRGVDHPLARRHVRATLATVVAVTVVTLPSFSFGLLAKSGTWRTPPHVEAARDLLAKIPDGASVAASNRLVPQLTSRCEVVLFPGYPEPGTHAEWIVHDRVPADDWPKPEGHWPQSLDEQLRALADAQRSGAYDVVAARDGITLLRRRS